MKWLVAAVLFIGVTAIPNETTGNEYRKAIAFISGLPMDNMPIHGNVTFTQQTDGTVEVEGIVLGLKEGKYGFHVHEKGDITGGCLSTGPHFNPEKKQHGAPTDTERHVGDLGNINFDEHGVAHIRLVDDHISLIGSHSIIGRGLVLHSAVDDLGKGSHPASKTTGNAGGRAACGVIGIL